MRDGQIADAQVARVTSQAEFRVRIVDVGYTPIAIDPKKFGEFVQAENQRWAPAIKAACIRVDK